MREVIRLHCCFVFVYIYISVPVNTRHLDCAITSCSSLAHNTTTSSTSTESEQIFAHKHFNALGGIHIFAGLANCAVVAYMVSASWPFWLTSFYPHAWDRFYWSLGGGAYIQAHPSGFALGRVHISGWQLRSRHILYCQDKGPIFRLLSDRKVYTLSAILLKSVTSEHPAFLCMP